MSTQGNQQLGRYMFSKKIVRVVWNKTFENKSIEKTIEYKTKKHRRQKKLFVLKYANRNINR